MPARRDRSSWNITAGLGISDRGTFIRNVRITRTEEISPHDIATTTTVFEAEQIQFARIPASPTRTRARKRKSTVVRGALRRMVDIATTEFLKYPMLSPIRELYQHAWMLIQYVASAI